MKLTVVMMSPKKEHGCMMNHIPIPEGLDLSDKQDGDEVKILLTAKLMKGALMPLALDGVPVESPKMEEEMESEEEGSEEGNTFLGKLDQAIQGGDEMPA